MSNEKRKMRATNELLTLTLLDEALLPGPVLLPEPVLLPDSLGEAAAIDMRLSIMEKLVVVTMPTKYNTTTWSMQSCSEKKYF